jgi:RimJ/RimL family protein N-acetyltransferase
VKNIIETERLFLRELSVEDAEMLFEIYCNSETMKFLGQPPEAVEVERENIEKHIENYYRRFGFGFWATILKENRKLIGRCGLLQKEIDGKTETEIGYLISQDFWRQGLATEAAAAILNYGFGTLKLKRIVAVVHPQNLASIRVAEKTKMKFEKRIDYGDYKNVNLYAISR